MAAPFFSANPATVRLVLAPTRVPFPPRQAPKASAHQTGVIASLPPMAGAIPWISGIMVARRGMLSTKAERTADAQSTTSAVTRTSLPVSASSSWEKIQFKDARLVQRTNDNEKSDEEHCDPFHRVEGLAHHLGVVLRLRGQVSNSIRMAAPREARWRPLQVRVALPIRRPRAQGQRPQVSPSKDGDP
jgi:hypothetical protein